MLWGSAGRDAFVFGAGDLGFTDSVADFARGKDRIDVSGLAGRVAFIGARAFAGDGESEVRVVRQVQVARVVLDVAGNGVGDFVL